MNYYAITWNATNQTYDKVDQATPKYVYFDEQNGYYDTNYNPVSYTKGDTVTVGLALDLSGNLAAGTSNGGMTNKNWNRIGDAPIIGAGTYANNATCAISATGWGEFFIRSVVAHDISALMEYKGLTIQEAAYEVIHNKVAKLGGDGGVVGIDRNGNTMMEMNTTGMYRAHMDAAGNLEVKIYQDE